MDLTLLLIVISFGCSAVSAMAPTCNVTACKLPNCRCTSTVPPNNMAKSTIPQMVLLTFDDAVTARFYSEYYKHLFDRKNPNGCPIGITFFASHEYCDYSLVHDLWTRGHEIGVHSISHKADIEYWRDGDVKVWTDEMAGMKQILQEFGKIPAADLKGIRAPFLQTAGNRQFEMMKKENFLFDSSMPTITYAYDGMWPFTLDYENQLDCPLGPCPDESFPGVWVFPMIDLFDKNEIECAMLDTCRVVDEDETYNLLVDNFKRHYEEHRAPYGLYIHAAWFLSSKGHHPAYIRFLDYLKNMDDVYIVTMSQALEWVRNPKPLSEIKNYAPWKTTCTKKASNCPTSKNCKLFKDDPNTGGERYMRACVRTCPCAYPWVGDPLGKNCKSG